ncbi:MAG TPA: ABC transporter ATP-binding protein [Myxococcota bacterium]|nr:ABC transporter ATP-binding protein [Myxococcota bacterium]
MLGATELRRSFRDPVRGEVRAVDGVSLQVDSGEVFALLGPNGAGKTTTLRMLATLLRPDAGSITIDGVDATCDPVAARARLAYVPAEAGLPPRLSPREAVRLFARIQGAPVSAVDPLLEQLGAGDYADTECGSLSTGMKRRVVLARALVHSPSVLLLDEPTDGLDVGGRRQVLDILRELAGDGRAVLLSSHILGEAWSGCCSLRLSCGPCQCSGRSCGPALTTPPSPKAWTRAPALLSGAPCWPAWR